MFTSVMYIRVSTCRYVRVYACLCVMDTRLSLGDHLYIISTEEGDWWFARSRSTGKEGYIPSNYVAEYRSLDAEEYVFVIPCVHWSLRVGRCVFTCVWVYILVFV